MAGAGAVIQSYTGWPDLFVPQAPQHDAALFLDLRGFSTPRLGAITNPSFPFLIQSPQAPAQPEAGGAIKLNLLPRLSDKEQKDAIIATGSSTGGTEALLAVLRGLPAQSPGVVCVQHMPAGLFIQMYVERLNNELPLAVREAADNVLITPGSVHIGPTGWHLSVERRGGQYYTRLKEDDKSSLHCPSADHLFHSAARAAGPNAVGVILTGMGADGAAGLLAMRRAGAFTIGQDESTCVVYGMPRKAFELGAVCRQAKLQDIPYVLLEHLMARK